MSATFIPVNEVMGDNNVGTYLSCFRGLSGSSFRRVGDVLIFSTMVCGRSHRFKGFNVLQSGRDNGIVKTTPVFSGKLSLFGFTIGSSFGSLGACTTAQDAPCNMAFRNVYGRIVNTGRQTRLQGLMNFGFAQRPSLGLSRRELATVRGRVSIHTERLLDLPEGGT